MLNATKTNALNANATSRVPAAVPAVTVELLTAKDEIEVLAFLSQRPIHTFAMKSFIHDNGLVSPLNRGSFYGCRDINGHLEGVALVGHATLMETVSDRALQALAHVARECSFTHMIMGEQERIAEFWIKLFTTWTSTTTRLSRVANGVAAKQEQFENLSLGFAWPQKKSFVR